MHNPVFLVIASSADLFQGRSEPVYKEMLVFLHYPHDAEIALVDFNSASLQIPIHGDSFLILQACFVFFVLIAEKILVKLNPFIGQWKKTCILMKWMVLQDQRFVSFLISYSGILHNLGNWIDQFLQFLQNVLFLVENPEKFDDKRESHL